MSMFYTDIISWHFRGNIELYILEDLEKFSISPVFLSLVVGLMTVKVSFVSGTLLLKKQTCIPEQPTLHICYDHLTVEDILL